MGNAERNAEIRRFFEIEGWDRDAIIRKYGISARTLRRILNVDVQIRPADVEKILTVIETKEAHKFSLYKENEFIKSANDLMEFEEPMGKLNAGKLNWIQERLNTSSEAMMSGYTIKLGSKTKEAKKEATLESLNDRVNLLEKTLREVMENTTDRDIMNVIKRNLGGK